jgi:hypothetical protein
MEVEMGHCLPGVRPIIGNNAEAAGQKSLLLGNPSRQRQRIRHHLGVTGLMGSQRWNVAARDDQDMDRRLRRQIPKRDAMRALGNEFGP